MPSGIKQAVIAIWATIAISALLALYQRMSGHAPNETFIIELILCSLLCILPYKISNGSNAARYAYLVLTVASGLMFISNIASEKMNIENTVSLLQTPVEFFILYRLFQKGTSTWFK